MIEFTSRIDWRWLALGAVAAVAFLFWSYRTATSKTRGGLRWFLISLRWLAMAGTALCLLNPQWVQAIKHQQKSRVAVLLDGSRSMGLSDVPGGRLGAAKDWLSQRVAPALPEGLQVDYFAFHRSLTPLPSPDSASPTGSVSGLADALESLLGVPRDGPLSGVVLCSDGIENLRADAESVARTFRRKGVPIHTFLSGTTNDVRDIVVENVQVRRAVRSDAPTRLTVSLRSPGFAGVTAPMEIRLGGQVVASQSVLLNGASQKAEIDFTPWQKGYHVFNVAVPAQSGEWLAANNRRAFGLEVVDQTIRVIYMEGTIKDTGQPEWQYLKDGLESDPNIKVKVLYCPPSSRTMSTATVYGSGGEGAYHVRHPTQGFPRTMAALLNYDVVINSDIVKEAFTAEQLRDTVRFVEEFGGGFIMIGGNAAFGKGGYHRTIIDKIIPVAMESEFDRSDSTFRMGVPVAALMHPLMAIGASPQESALIWGPKFPYLYGYNTVDRAKPGAVLLGVDPTSRNNYGLRVVLAAQEVGKGRTMAFTSDTTYSWGRDFETKWGEPTGAAGYSSRYGSDSRYYRKFWINAIRWLGAGKIGKTNNPVSLELSQSGARPGEPVIATVRVTDARPTELSAAEVSVSLLSGGTTNQTVPARYDAASGAFRAELRLTAAGDFTALASASLLGQRRGEDRQLLVCEDVDLEMADVRANPRLMAELARASGGRAFSADDADAPDLRSLFGAPPPVTLEHRRTPLWDKSWWLLTLVGLLALEWVVRRVRGLA
ncbi:MAG: hypothetical protein HZA90_27215 [Verrucomicrobia bacterium]|nr:hypothetical protein [Verrucomicrobiota bacterium]